MSWVRFSAGACGLLACDLSGDSEGVIESGEEPGDDQDQAGVVDLREVGIAEILKITLREVDPVALHVGELGALGCGVRLVHVGPWCVRWCGVRGDGSMAM